MTAPLQFVGLDSAVLPNRPLHLAIGMFDGVHLGHRAVIEAAVQSAHRTSGVAAVLTFSPHPSVVLRPENPTRLIHDISIQVALLGALGVEAVIKQPFTTEFAKVDAESFIPLLKAHFPQLSAIYVGENWRFGQGRKGEIGFLVGEGRKHGIAVFSAPRVNFNGEAISSTRIRSLLEAGDVEGAASLLGYKYFAEGPVISGKRLGRTIGFPTLNLDWDQALRPRLGVYRVQVFGRDGQGPYPGVANYGLRPTVEQTLLPRLEVFLLTDCPFDTGDFIRVEWLGFIRPEQKFSGLEELKAQIGRDVAQARKEFSLP